MTDKITFSAEGTVTQEINIIDPDYTVDSIAAGLRSGKLMTTIGGGRYIEQVLNGHKVAEIIDTDNELEYFDFDVQRDLGDLNGE